MIKENNEQTVSVLWSTTEPSLKELPANEIAAYWLSAIIESADDAIISKTLEGVITSWNKGAARLFGYTAEEIIGKPVLVLIPSDHQHEETEILSRIKRGERVEHFETTRQHKDGTLLYVSLTVSPIKDHNGNIIGASKIARDITGRKQAEEMLLERAHHEALNGDIGAALVQADALEGLLNRCAESLVKHLGVSFARIWTFNEEEKILELKASAGIYTHLDGAHSRIPLGKFKIGLIAEERVPHLTNDVLNDSRVSDQEWAKREGMIAFAGYPLIVEDRLVGVMCAFAKRQLSEATLEAMASVSNGIANGIERKRIEDSLRQSEEQYRLVAETASDAIISIDEQSTILFINRAATRIFGYEIEEMLGQNLAMLMPEYLREAHKAGQERYIKTGKRHLQWESIEVPGLHRDGHEFPLELSFGEYNKNNRHIFIGIARDVSERKKAEALLLESEQKFATLAEVVPQLVWMAEADGFIFWYNRNWYEYTGTTPADMEGWGWQSVHDPEMLPQVMEGWQASIQTGQPFKMEFPIRGRDGQFRWFLTRVNPLRNSEGRIVRWFGTNTDIDEQRRLDQRNRFIIQLDETVRSLETPEEITLTLARLLGEYLDADRCAYAEVEADEDHFVIPGDYTKGDIHSIVGRYSMADFGATVLRLMRENQPYVVHDVDTDPQVTKDDLAAYRMTAIQAVICVPLHKNNRFSACMAVHQKTPRKWLPEEVELVSFVANRFWESIERARTVKILHESFAREQTARHQAEEANRLKDEFLAMLSHELRTPLNAILGWSQMLQTNNPGESQRKKALATIERNARSQSQLIDDLLDVSRIITGKLRLDVRAVDLPGVIVAAVDSVRPAAEAKNIRLQILLDPQAGPISGDPDRLQQVVWNLLSNAVKFTPKAGRVQVRLERVNSHIEISVSDTGKGIEPDFLPFVFDRFRQSDGSMTRRHGGLGLGLAIVRQLVELHGGMVSVSSAGEEQGSTFTVSLPLLPVRREPESAVPRVHPKAENGSFQDCPPELNDLRVLLVDDEADSRDLLSLVLDSCGANVTTVSSAAEALQAINGEKFDALISDIGMPEEDGFSLIGKIRQLADEQGGNIPAIALTAYARAEDRVQALRSGFQMHIAKPVEATELVVAVANLAGRMRSPK